MFKGTNKFWKGLALLLVLCMLPTVALASETNTITVEGDWVKINEEGSNVTVTVTGSISDAEADVTILAVRDAGEVTLETVGTWSDEILKNKVVYIDQESFDGGNFEFNFIPKSGVKGGKLTVFVGGENVNEVKSKSEDAAVTAPDVVPVTPWYEGTPLKLNIYKAETTEPYGDEAAVKGWFDDINSFKVNGGDSLATTGEGAPVTRLGNVITVTGVTATEQAPLTAIAITTNANSYKEETWEGSVKQDPKAAGTLTADKATITAGDPAKFTVDSTSAMEGWIDAVEANVYIDGVKAGDGLATLSGTTLSVTLPELGNTAESKEYTVTIKVANYAVASAKVTAIAPTKVAADEAEVERNYIKVDDAYDTDPASVSETETDPDKLLAMYGYAVVTLPTPAEGSGLTYKWEIAKPAAAQDITIAPNAASVTLDRPDYVAVPDDNTVDSYDYTLTLTVEHADYKTSEPVTFPVSASRVGMKGAIVTITPNFTGATSAEIAKMATYTLTPKASGTPIVIRYDGTGFTATAVPLGDYVLKIERAGYVDKTVDVTVGSSGLETFTMPTMVAGDLDDDGKIYSSDLQLLLAAYNKAEGSGYSATADLDADGKVYASDLQLLLANYNK